MLIASLNPSNVHSAIRIYVGVKRSAERIIEAHPTNSDGAPRLFSPRNLVIIYKFAEQPITDVDIIRVNGVIGLIF